ncbi:MAG: hypothetical protein ACFFDN_44375, partial [Candidatus Hodarchaeota archaeon]
YVESPAGTQADTFILQFAWKNNAYIISNDRFLDFYDKYGKEWIKQKKITFSFIAGAIYFDKVLA